MKYLVDYHVHTNNSFDSNVEMFSYCQKAIQLGLKEIVFTEHYDLNPVDQGLGFFDYAKYSQEIEKCREVFGAKLLIKKGLELGEPHLYLKEHAEFLTDKDFDFLLGSVHFIEDRVLHREYDEEDEREVYLEYFQEVLNLANYGEFNVLGHLDVLKRYVPKYFAEFKALDYREIVEEILKALVKNDRGMEINTSGFRQGLNDTLPTKEIIQWYHQLGGKIITVGSDAHHLGHLGRDIKTGIQLAQEIGFPGISIFNKGVPQIVPFK